MTWFVFPRFSFLKASFALIKPLGFYPLSASERFEIYLVIGRLVSNIWSRLFTSWSIALEICMKIWYILSHCSWKCERNFLRGFLGFELCNTIKISSYKVQNSFLLPHLIIIVATTKLNCCSRVWRKIHHLSSNNQFSLFVSNRRATLILSVFYLQPGTHGDVVSRISRLRASAGGYE